MKLLDKLADEYTGIRAGEICKIADDNNYLPGEYRVSLSAEHAIAFKAGFEKAKELCNEDLYKLEGYKNQFNDIGEEEI